MKSIQSFFNPIPFLVLFIFFSITNTALCAISNKAQIEAVFIEKFTRFITWPNKITTFNLCVYNNDTFSNALQTIYKTRKIKEKSVNVKNILEPFDNNNYQSCNLLYISTDDEQELQKILHLIEQKPILTISSHKNFAKIGTMINFTKSNNHIQFELNVKNLDVSHIQMSSMLLNAAKIRY
jgi:hypothetical protein